jgi:hypothetical protein
MQHDLIREIGSATGRANLAQVEVMAQAFWTQTDPVEESLVEIAVISQAAEVSFIKAGYWILVAVLGVRVGVRSERTTRLAYLKQHLHGLIDRSHSRSRLSVYATVLKHGDVRHA